MTQEQFDKIYDEGIENNQLSLTESNTITTNDLIDAALYRMFKSNMSAKEITIYLNKRVKQFENE